MIRKAKESDLTKTGKCILGKYYEFTLGRDNVVTTGWRWATLDELKEVIAYRTTDEGMQKFDEEFEEEK